MNTIKLLHHLDDEISELQCDYAKALQCVWNLRTEKAKILREVEAGNLDNIKRLFMSDDLQGQLYALENPDNVIPSTKMFPPHWKSINI